MIQGSASKYSDTWSPWTGREPDGWVLTLEPPIKSRLSASAIPSFLSSSLQSFCFVQSTKGPRPGEQKATVGDLNQELAGLQAEGKGAERD